MWFRRRKKQLIQSFLVLCLLLLVTCQLYAILVRHEPSGDELGLADREPGRDRVVSPRRPGQDDSLEVNESIPKDKDWNGTGGRVGPERNEESKVPGVMGKSGERIDHRVVDVVPRSYQAEAFHSHEIVNRTLFVNNQRRLQTELKDIFISVKTTGKFHKARVEVLLKTWFGLAVDQVVKTLC